MHGVTAHYGASQVLFGMELTLEQGQLVTLLGRNGMGKTTTVRAIMGMVAVAAGRISLDGTELIGLPTHVIAQAGIGLVPEGRQIFPNLTARENLIATAANRRGRATPWTLERVLDLFPGLAARAGHLGSALSGGEQQMLAIGRALMTNPKVLLLDEATEGLAPLVRSEIWAVLESLKREGESILLIDKNLQSLLRLADRHYVMERGRTVWCGSSTELAGRRDLQMRYLGV
jgi:branched-chain amino acid transport system ATP-binding protein